MLTRIICSLLRHPLEPIAVHDRDPQTGEVCSIVGERCRCARRVGAVKVHRGQFPQRRGLLLLDGGDDA